MICASFYVCTISINIFFLKQKMKHSLKERSGVQDFKNTL